MTVEKFDFVGIEKALDDGLGVLVWRNGFGICSTRISTDITSDDTKNNVGTVAWARGYTVDDALRNVSQNYLQGMKGRVDEHLYTEKGIKRLGAESVVPGTLENANPISMDLIDQRVRGKGDQFYAVKEVPKLISTGIRWSNGIPLIVSRADTFTNAYDALRCIEISPKLEELFKRGWRVEEALKTQDSYTITRVRE